MTSFYEKIMELPLFKGADFNLIHNFIEKTPLLFNRYADGDSIIYQDEACEGVTCLLDGIIIIENRFGNDQYILRRKLKHGIVLGAEFLFGLRTQYPYSVRAVGKCSTVTFSKSQYVMRLHDSNILMVNYLNYLSKRAQKGFNSFNRDGECNEMWLLKNFIELSTERHSYDIELICPKENSIFSNVSKNFIEQLKQMHFNRLVEIKSDNRLYIPDRSQFLA